MNNYPINKPLLLPRISPSNDKKRRVVYECYKPDTQSELQEYIDFVLGYRSIISNEKEYLTEIIPDISFEYPPLGLSQKLTMYLRTIGKQRKSNEDCLWFDSNFECGNLERAIIKDDNEYDLYLNSDINAPNAHQWFYFSVENTIKQKMITFNILNITKFSPFYATGEMKPVVFSVIDYKDNSGTWTNSGITNCALYKTVSGICSYGKRIIPITCSIENPNITPTYYTLSFSYTFKNSKDKVYFAFSRPYCFTRLCRTLSKMETELFQNPITATCENVNSKPQIRILTKDLYYERIRLCTTAGGIPVECLTITAPEQISKKYVVITGRIHAAETPGSNKIEGILDFLLSSHKIAISLRNKYNFIVVPMLNPDGVVMGNTRYSVEGDDLNRCWDNPLIDIHPAIHSLKEMLKVITSENEIKMYCDLHGHSKKYNSFIYACHHVANATHGSWLSTRLLARILSQKCKMFDYYQCLYSVKPDKLNTGRVIVWKEFKVTNSFTLESSIFGYEEESRKYLFSDSDYAGIGKALMLSLYEYDILLGKLKNNTKGVRQVLDEVKDEYKRKKDIIESYQNGSKTEGEASIKNCRTMYNIGINDTKHMSDGKKKLTGGLHKILQADPLVEQYIDKAELVEVEGSNLFPCPNIDRKRAHSYISNSEHCAKKTVNKMSEGEITKAPLRLNIIGMREKSDLTKKSTIEVVSCLKPRVQNTEQERLVRNVNMAKKTPIEIRFTTTVRKRAIDSITRTGIFFNPYHKAEFNDNMLNIDTHDSSAVNVKMRNKLKNQYCKAMNKTQIKDLPYKISSFLTPTRIRERMTKINKNAGLINFSRKLDKSKIKSILYNHKLAQIMLCRHKKIKAYEFFPFPRNKRTSFTEFSVGNPTGSRSFSYYTSTEGGLLRRENIPQQKLIT